MRANTTSTVNNKTQQAATLANGAKAETKKAATVNADYNVSSSTAVQAGNSDNYINSNSSVKAGTNANMQGGNVIDKTDNTVAETAKTSADAVKSVKGKAASEIKPGLNTVKETATSQKTDAEAKASAQASATGKVAAGNK